jgi:site-specific DNA-methyltransferase (adenine-specific)
MKINKIYTEDCLKTMNKMSDNFIDLVVTSPPYDNLRTYKKFDFQYKKVSKELFRVIKDGGVCVWVVGDQTIKGNETGTSFKHALFFKEIGFNLFDTMIYQKKPRGAVGNNKTYWQTFEYMFIFSKGIPNTINLIKDRRNLDQRKGDVGTKRLKNGKLKKVSRDGYGLYGRRTNIWKYGVGKGQSSSDDIAFKHPAIFPEKLAYDHIYSWSNKGDLIYDPFLGSGTTIVMAEKLNRNWIGSEVTSEYSKIAIQRLKNF